MNKIYKDKIKVVEAIDTIIKLSEYLCYLPDKTKAKRVKHLSKIRKNIMKERYDKIMKESWLDEVKKWEE